MDFFQQLAGISEGLDLTIRIKGKNGKLTISVLPESIEKVQPLITTGTPEQLDEQFFDSIRQPLTDAHQVVVNRAEFDQSLKDASDNKSASKKSVKNLTPEVRGAEKVKREAAKKKSKPAAAKPEKKAAPAKEAKPKPEPKKEEPKKEGPTQLSIV